MPATFADLTDLVRARVDADAPDAFDRAHARALSLGPEIVAPVGAVRDLTLRGGKRVRASLVALGYWAASGALDLAPLAPALVAYELFQSYLLVHDDWIDGDAVRRGGPSVPAALEAVYGGRDLGSHTGVLAGDLACALAFDELARCELPASRVLASVRLLARVHGDVVIGQLADVLAPSMATPPVLERVHALKTGSYTVEGPLVLGATLGGATEPLLDGLRRLGRPLGLAFQLRDDLLGTFGREEATGKAVGSDVREGKRTALVAEVESDAEVMRLFRAARGDAPPEAVAELLVALERCGARARVEETLASRLGEARAGLASLAVPADVRRVLADAIDVLGVRSTLELPSGRGMSGVGQGKVILVGEHAVVYGVPALAVGIDRGARAERVAGEGPSSLSVRTWNIRVDVGSAGVGDLLATAFDVLLAETRRALGPGSDLEGDVHVVAEADLPAGGGLGCSAAVGVAVARALDPGASAGVIAERVGVWENVFHGNASGVDAAVSAHGGGLVFRRGHPFEPVRLRRRLHLAIGHSGNASSTKAMVEAVARHRSRNVEAAQRTFDAIGTIAANARLALEAGDVSALGKLLDLNQMLLAGLFVSTPEIEQMCSLARGAGALGAKLTGAGGGGCVVALVDGEPAAEHVLEVWRKDGFTGFSTSVGTGSAAAARATDAPPP